MKKPLARQRTSTVCIGRGYGVYRERPRRGAGRVVVGKCLEPRRLQTCPFTFSTLLKPKGRAPAPRWYWPDAPAARGASAFRIYRRKYSLKNSTMMGGAEAGVAISRRGRRFGHRL